MGAIAFLDESKSVGHPILSVGGFVAEIEDLPELERRWREGKAACGLDPSRSYKHAGDWPDQEPRSRLVELIGQLPLRAVIALLEDFRPETFREKKALRSELYVQKEAFRYVVQRLVTIYFGSDGGPHFVAFDHRDDFKELSTLFASLHGRESRLTYNKLPSPRSIGVCESLLISDKGPANEIADFVTSAFTRWVGRRCLAGDRPATEDYRRDERSARALVPLFPTHPQSETWRGYSVVTHTQSRTGKELLASRIDRWMRDLIDPPGMAEWAASDDDIPF